MSEMRLDGPRGSDARRSRRLTIEEHGHEPSLHVLLPEPHRRRGARLQLPYPSEIFPTEYNQRLPEWRWRAGNNAYHEHWRNTREYVMVALGCSIGLSNFVNFAMLALRYRKGPFLYVYILMEFLIGFPMLFLHLALGQFTAKDATWLFGLVPLARGIGVSFMIYSLVRVTIQNVELSWIAYYMFASLNIKLSPPFSWKLPWTDCELRGDDIEHQNYCNHYPITDLNDPQIYCIIMYFHDVVLGNHGNCTMVGEHGYHSSWEINWPLVGCVFFVTCLVYAIAFRGLKTIGRFVFVVVPSTCVLLLAMSFYEIVSVDNPKALAASLGGLGALFAPEDGVANLYDWDMWFTAASHVVTSLSLDTGSMIFIGSNARFQSAAHYHALFIVVADVGFSIMSAMIIFCHLNVLDLRLAHHVDALEFQGRNNFRSYLFYIISAIENMKGLAAPFLFVYFFFVLSLGVMKLMVTEAVILSPIKEMYPALQDKWNHLVDFVASLVFVLMTLPFLTRGSTVRFPLLAMFDQAPMMYCPILLIMFTAITFVYIYGLQRLRQDIDFMLQYFPNGIYCAAWYCTPFLCSAIIIGNIIGGDIREESRIEPRSKVAIWFVFCLIFLPVVVFAIWTFVHYYRTGKLSKIRHPLLESYIPKLDDPKRPTPVMVPEHDSNLTRQDAITTLSSINDQPGSKEKVDAALLDLSVTLDV